LYNESVVKLLEICCELNTTDKLPDLLICEELKVIFSQQIWILCN